MVHQERIHIETQGHGTMHDITEKVQKIVNRSGVDVGTTQVFNIGSTDTVQMWVMD